MSFFNNCFFDGRLFGIFFFPTTQTNWDFYLLYSIECDMFAKLEDSKVIYLLVSIFLSCTTYIYIQDNDSLIGQQWIVVTYLYWYTLIIIFILFINCILMLLLYIYTMPCLLRFLKYFIFTVIGSSILQPLNVVGARNSKTSQTL